MLVTFYRIRAFHEVVIRVQHINSIMHEVETIHKVMSCIMDRDKDLVQKNKSAGDKKWLVYWFHLVLMCNCNFICDCNYSKKIRNEKRVAYYDFAIATLKKKGFKKNRLYLRKKISANQFCSWQIVVYALGHQVVPDNFEFFCLGFILIEDCVATLNIPLHTRGEKGPLKN
jgi:hypothetical protein